MRHKSMPETEPATQVVKNIRRATRRLLLGRQARIILDPIAGRRAEAGFGGSNGSVAGLSVTHDRVKLLIRLMIEGSDIARPPHHRPPDEAVHGSRPPDGFRKTRRRRGLPSVGRRPPPSACPRRILILIDAASSTFSS